jgi:hypothetical protein
MDVKPRVSPSCLRRTILLYRRCRGLRDSFLLREVGAAIIDSNANTICRKL